jgi:nuclear pore complex protein Nup93
VHFLLNQAPAEGVHFAVVLAWYGLLRITTTPNVFEDDLCTLPPPTSPPKPVNPTVTLEKDKTDEYPAFNFAKCLALYAKNFIRTASATSFEYLSLITLNTDLPRPTSTHQTTALQDAIRDLVIESRDFATLLGDIRPDGTRDPGIIERKARLLVLSPSAVREYIRRIVEKAAALVDDEGDTSSAVLLYHLSEDYSLVLATINRRLADVFMDASSPVYADDALAQEEGAAKMNLSLAAVADPAALAGNVLAMYEANGSILQRLDNRERETCKVLLGMIEARKAFIAGCWEASIQVTPLNCFVAQGADGQIIEELDLIPLSGSPSTLKRYAQNVPLLSDAVAKNIPGLLVMVMQALVNISKQLREAVYADPSKERKLIEGRRKGGNVVVFAGLIQYRMGGEVYETLTRLEGMI